MQRLLESGRLAFNWNAMTSCYHSQMKAREGNVFTPVCKSFCSQGVPSRGFHLGGPSMGVLTGGWVPSRRCCPGWGAGCCEGSTVRWVPWSGAMKGRVPWRGCTMKGLLWRGCHEEGAVKDVLWMMLWRGYHEGGWDAVKGVQWRQCHKEVLWRGMPWMGWVLWRGAVKGVPWRNPLWSTSRQYASYWNAFLLNKGWVRKVSFNNNTF